VGLPWVISVDETPQPNGVQLAVAVSDDEAAEASLLRTVLAEDRLRVRSFGRRRFQLEDVFMTLIEGNGGAR
jgi:hypothetical protein